MIRLAPARYRIVGLLGRGGMGEVYRADDLTLGQPVALKFLGGDEPPWRRACATRPARPARSRIPMSVGFMTSAKWDGRPFVSMEYVDGEDLASLLRRIGRLPADKAVEIVRQVCAGLAAAHERGVLHRDLKPANVMLDGRGKVRITDFGLASFVDDDRSGEIAGRPRTWRRSSWSPAGCRRRPICMPSACCSSSCLRARRPMAR